MSSTLAACFKQISATLRFCSTALRSWLSLKYRSKQRERVAYLDQGRTVRRGMIVSRWWARGWPRAPGRDGTASGGENSGLVTEQHLPDLHRTAADPSAPQKSAGRRTPPRVAVRFPIDWRRSRHFPSHFPNPATLFRLCLQHRTRNPFLVLRVRHAPPLFVERESMGIPLATSSLIVRACVVWSTIGYDNVETLDALWWRWT